MSEDVEDKFPEKVTVNLHQTLEGHEFPVPGACFSNDSHGIVSYDFSVIHVWRRNDQQHYVSHCVIDAKATAVAISHDGRFIAFIYEDRILGKKVRLWSSEGTWIKDVPYPDAVTIIFALDDRYLAVIDSAGCVTLLDVPTLTLLCTSDLPPGGPPDRTRKAWNNLIRFLDFAPDGQRLAVEWYNQDGAVQIYTIEETVYKNETLWKIRWSSSVAPQIVQADSKVNGLSYSPNWQYIAVGSDKECVVWIFDAFSLNVVRSFAIPRSIEGIADIAYSSEGTYLVVAHGNGMVEVCDGETLNSMLTFPAHTSVIGAYSTVIGSISWSPNDKLIMTTGVGRYENVDAAPGVSFHENDYTVKLWKVHKNSHARKD